MMFRMSILIGLIIVSFLNTSQEANAQASTIIMMSSVNHSYEPNMICKSINTTASLCSTVPYTAEQQHWMFWWPIIFSVFVVSVCLLLFWIVIREPKRSSNNKITGTSTRSET